MGVLRSPEENNEALFGDWHLTEKQISIVDGLLLGDATCVSTTKRSSIISLQLVMGEVVKYYRDLLAPPRINQISYTPENAHIIMGRVCQCKPLWHWSTGAYPSLHHQRERWYKNSKKIVPQDVRINRLSVLAWYLGDGTLSHGRSGKASICPIFMTNGFTEEDVFFLVTKLVTVQVVK